MALHIKGINRQVNIEVAISPEDAEGTYQGLAKICRKHGGWGEFWIKHEATSDKKHVTYSCNIEFANGAANLRTAYFGFANGAELVGEVLLMGSRDLWQRKSEDKPTEDPSIVTDIKQYLKKLNMEVYEECV